MYRQSSVISYSIISRYVSFLDKITKHLLCSPLTAVKFKVQLQRGKVNNEARNFEKISGFLLLQVMFTSLSTILFLSYVMCLCLNP